MISLSIIIPCYNVGQYIGATIASLKKQTRNDIEFFFVNDGSTDNTKEIICSFAASDNRVKLIDKQNGGVSAARNDALAAAEGEYIYLLDGDDYLTDNAAEAMITYLKRSNCDMLLTNIWLVNGSDKTLYRHRIPEGIYTPNDLFNTCAIFPTQPKNVYRRSIITKNEIRFNEKTKCGEVYEFTVNFMHHAQSISVVDDCFAHYVMRSDSAIHKVNHEADRSTLDLIEALYRNGDAFTDCISFHLTAFQMVTSFTYNKYLLTGNNTPEVKETLRQMFGNAQFIRCAKKVAWQSHKCHTKRILAIYILIFKQFGFSLAVNVQKILRLKNHLSTHS